MQEVEAAGLNRLRDVCHGLAREKGWYEGGERNVGEQLALIHSEVSEALEEYRDSDPALLAVPYRDEKGKPCGFAIELADVLIRVLDLAGYMGIDLDRVVAEKVEYNRSRPYRHGGKRC